MSGVRNIFEIKGVFEFLKSRNLIKQYKKAKNYLLDGRTLTVRFKERNPKGSGVWYFRINQQYRAYGVFNAEGDLIVYEINDHQNG